MELSPNFKKMMGMVEGMKTLPETAAGPSQKPVPEGFGWKPSDAQTAQDIANAKTLEPLERQAFFDARTAPEQIKQEVNKALPTEEDMISMNWQDLYNLRQGKSPEEQNRIAPYEHRAFAREYIKENPEAAIVMPGMIYAYNIAKGLGISKGRSDAGPKAIAEALKGWLEGIGGATKEGVNKLLENYQELQKDLTWTPLPSGEQVWEEGNQNGTKIKKELKGK
jgi:hypothetical protein